MITADKVKLLINMPTALLTAAINQSGYKKDKFQTSRFLGMTNAGQFCYSATYIEDNEPQECKVFVSFDSATDSVTASY